MSNLQSRSLSDVLNCRIRVLFVSSGKRSAQGTPQALAACAELRWGPGSLSLAGREVSEEGAGLETT